MPTNRLVLYALWISLLVGLHCSILNAQSINDIKRFYPFIKLSKNKLQNDSLTLNRFYEQLLVLKTDRQNTVRITHIGDSHIQADFFSGKVREELQLNFGNAGRGLVVPYKVARTNEPYTYQTSSSIVWRSKRNIALADSLPIGVGGITIRTDSPKTQLKLHVINRPNLNYSFNRITLFHDKCDACFDFDLKDTCPDVIGMIRSAQGEGKRFTSFVHLPYHTNDITLETRLRSLTSPSYTSIYGMLLENGKPGILYNTIGVNGAEYRHYNRAIHFQEQIGELQSDLYIISLGTNETFGRSFDVDTFVMHIDTLISALRKTTPQANIIITLPGDHFRRKKYRNNNIPIAQKAMINYCEKHQLAYWDLFEIMGGLGSIAKWHGKNMTSGDLLHLNRKGYEVEGKLLFEAINNGFIKYERAKLR